jgi:hypothetical protein
MDAAWWAALGAPARWPHIFTGVTRGFLNSPAVSGGYAWQANWLRLGISLGASDAFYQAPFITGDSDGGVQSDDNDYDTGFFYLTDAVGPDRYPYICAINGIPNGWGIANGDFPQCAYLQPMNDEYELRPVSDPDSGNPLFSAYYKTGFIYSTGDDGAPTYSNVTTWFKCPAKGQLVTINHYSPFAWQGSPPEVIAAILLQLGMPAAYIDQVAFTRANLMLGSGGGYLIGGESGPDEAWNPQAYAVRAVGRKVVDLVTEIMRHGRDVYYANEAGVLDVSCYTDPLDIVTSLTLEDGVVSVEYSWEIKYVFNKVAAGWGSAYRCWGSPADPPDSTGFACQLEEELDSCQDCKYVHEASNAASVAKYGEIWLKGRKRTTSGSKGKEVESSHYGLFLDPGCLAGYWETYGYGGMMHVTNWLTSDSKERRFVTVVQDFLALDWGIGARVRNVAVTDDGQTIADTVCIERTYDFDRLTVTSLLMELPANT